MPKKTPGSIDTKKLDRARKEADRGSKDLERLAAEARELENLIKRLGKKKGSR